MDMRQARCVVSYTGKEFTLSVPRNASGMFTADMLLRQLHATYLSTTHKDNLRDAAGSNSMSNSSGNMSSPAFGGGGGGPSSASPSPSPASTQHQQQQPFRIDIIRDSTSTSTSTGGPKSSHRTTPRQHTNHNNNNNSANTPTSSSSRRSSRSSQCSTPDHQQHQQGNSSSISGDLLYLIFDVKYLDRFPGGVTGGIGGTTTGGGSATAADQQQQQVTSTTTNDCSRGDATLTAELQAHVDRQERCLELLKNPVVEHTAVFGQELGRSLDVARRIHAEYTELAEALPQMLQRLSEIPLLENNTDEEGAGEEPLTLRDRVSGLEGIVTDSGRSLERSMSDFNTLESRFEETMQRLREKGMLSSPPHQGGDTSSHNDAMMKDYTHKGDNNDNKSEECVSVSDLQLQHQFEQNRRRISDTLWDVKEALKAIELLRREERRGIQAVKAVRDAVLGKLRMVKALPEAYAAATAHSKRRVVLHIAAKRVNRALLPECERVREELRDFMKTWGPLFPSNLIPGIQHPPSLPLPEDPVARFAHEHCQATLLGGLDDDEPSQLLIDLGVYREAAPAATHNATSPYATTTVETHEMETQTTPPAKMQATGVSNSGGASASETVSADNNSNTKVISSYIENNNNTESSTTNSNNSIKDQPQPSPESLQYLRRVASTILRETRGGAGGGGGGENRQQQKTPASSSSLNANATATFSSATRKRKRKKVTPAGGHNHHPSSSSTSSLPTCSSTTSISTSRTSKAGSRSVGSITSSPVGASPTASPENNHKSSCKESTVVRTTTVFPASPTTTAASPENNHKSSCKESTVVRTTVFPASPTTTAASPENNHKSSCKESTVVRTTVFPASPTTTAASPENNHKSSCKESTVVRTTTVFPASPTTTAASPENNHKSSCKESTVVRTTTVFPASPTTTAASPENNHKSSCKESTVVRTTVFPASPTTTEKENDEEEGGGGEGQAATVAALYGAVDDTSGTCGAQEQDADENDNDDTASSEFTDEEEGEEGCEDGGEGEEGSGYDLRHMTSMDQLDALVMKEVTALRAQEREASEKASEAKIKDVEETVAKKFEVRLRDECDALHQVCEALRLKLQLAEEQERKTKKDEDADKAAAAVAVSAEKMNEGAMTAQGVVNSSCSPADGANEEGGKKDEDGQKETNAAVAAPPPPSAVVAILKETTDHQQDEDLSFASRLVRSTAVTQHSTKALLQSCLSLDSLQKFFFSSQQQQQQPNADYLQQLYSFLYDVYFSDGVTFEFQVVKERTFLSGASSAELVAAIALQKKRDLEEGAAASASSSASFVSSLFHRSGGGSEHAHHARSPTALNGRSHTTPHQNVAPTASVSVSASAVVVGAVMPGPHAFRPLKKIVALFPDDQRKKKIVQRIQEGGSSSSSSNDVTTQSNPADQQKLQKTAKQQQQQKDKTSSAEKKNQACACILSGEVVQITSINLKEGVVFAQVAFSK